MNPPDWTPADALALQRRLLALGWRVAAAESLTCGRVQTALGATPGASACFAGGLTAYALAAKVALLGVDEAEARAVDAVSGAVALGMARGAARLFGAEVGVATTGYAEASPAAGVQLPFAFVAAVTPLGNAVERVELPAGDRALAQTVAAHAALRLLALRLGDGR